MIGWCEAKSALQRGWTGCLQRYGVFAQGADDLASRTRLKKAARGRFGKPSQCRPLRIKEFWRLVRCSSVAIRLH